jgi:DNA-directed RNA polymerase specialized sigma24 family protein
VADTETTALVQAARARLAGELKRLPGWGTPALWAALRAPGPEYALSLGALIHVLRQAAGAGDGAGVRGLFVRLLERTEHANRRWATREAARTGVPLGMVAELREELREELTLHLWEQIVLGQSDAWELFFARSLDCAQRHTAHAYLRKRGLRAKPGVARPTRARQRLLVSLSRGEEADGSRQEGEALAVADPATHFSAAELADLRALVEALPPRERTAVVMRYWQDASEAEVARGLGVSGRMVRYYLRRAHVRLREWYGPDGAYDVSGANGEEADDARG